MTAAMTQVPVPSYGLIRKMLVSLCAIIAFANCHNITPLLCAFCGTPVYVEYRVLRFFIVFLHAKANIYDSQYKDRGSASGPRSFVHEFLEYSRATSAPLMLCHTLKMAPGMVANG